MVGDHAHLVVRELVALADLLHHVVDGLRRDVHRQLIAVEARHRRMRLQARMLLGRDAEGALPPAADRARRALREPALGALALLRECRRGPRTLPFQGAGPPPPSDTLPARLRLAFSNTTGASSRRAASSPITAGRSSRSKVIAAAAAARSAVLGRDGRYRRADKTHHLIFREQRHGRRDAGNGARRRKIEPGDLRMRDRRAQDHAFELAVMPDVDGVAREPRHLVAGFHPRRDGVVAVEAPRTRLRHRAKNSLIGAAAAEMSGQRRGDLLARRHRRASGRAPAVMEGGRPPRQSPACRSRIAARRAP